MTTIITEAEYKELLVDNTTLQIGDLGDEVAITCPICQGDGKDPDGDYGCGSCAATGIGRGDPNTSHCSSCGGSGRASRYDPPCPCCDGAGYLYIELSAAKITWLRSKDAVLSTEPPRAYASSADDVSDYCPW